MAKRAVFSSIKEKNLSQSLDRGLMVLHQLAEKRLSLTEISIMLGVHKSTALRLLRVLSDQGMVRHDESHIYRLGPAIFSMGAAYLGALDIRAIASSHLRKLAEATELTVHLGAFDGSEVVYVDKFETSGTMRMYSAIGSAAPLHCTAVAKAVLAFLPSPQVDGLVRDIELTRYTDATITSFDGLMRELALTRQRGYAVDNREHEDFVHCVGVPIEPANQTVRFSLSVTAPVFTTDWDALKQKVPLLQKTAKAIARELT